MDQILNYITLNFTWWDLFWFYMAVGIFTPFAQYLGEWVAVREIDRALRPTIATFYRVATAGAEKTWPRNDMLSLDLLINLMDTLRAINRRRCAVDYHWN